TAWEPKPECMTGFLGAGRRPPGLPELNSGGALDTGAGGVLADPADGGGGLGSPGLCAAASEGGAAGKGTGGTGGPFSPAGTAGGAGARTPSLGGLAGEASVDLSTTLPVGAG